MERITLSVEYYNLLKRLRKKSEREVVALAIFEFAFEGIEPKDLSEASEIAFEGIRQSLEKSRNNGGRGGRKKQNRTETDLKPIDNRTETDLKPNKIEIEKNKEKKVEQKKDNKKDKDNPLFISPKTGEENTSFADEFFSKYPRYAKDRDKMRVDVDYKRLMEEFEKSTYLRSLYTVKQINDIYPCILTGDFRDQEKKPSSVDGFEEKAKRERWYSARREKAKADAEKIHKRFMQDEEYAKRYNRLREIDVAQGKAEAKGKMVEASKLEQERNRLQLEKRGIIERNGLTEEDLLPKWHCAKCKDTGFVNGIPCDCYEG